MLDPKFGGYSSSLAKPEQMDFIDRPSGFSLKPLDNPAHEVERGSWIRMFNQLSKPIKGLVPLKSLLVKKRNPYIAFNDLFERRDGGRTVQVREWLMWLSVEA